MGNITSALKKAAEDRISRIDKIAKIKEDSKRIVKKVGDSKVDSRIVSYFDPKALITEQYKVLRTNFLSLNKGRPPKTLMITSSLHSEGKTLTALNLAICLAQSVHKPKVLLIDADMRRGRICKYLGVHHEKGLSDVLSGKIALEDALFHLDLENLTLMACGAVPHNPAELLSSDQMRALLQELRGRYDYVLIDAPPVVAVTDAGIISAMVEGVLMIIQAGRTQRGIVDRSLELLQQAHANVVGHVLTNIEYHLPEYIYRYL